MVVGEGGRSSGVLLYWFRAIFGGFSNKEKNPTLTSRVISDFWNLFSFAEPLIRCTTFYLHMQGEVYMYYGLTNFYQNHRRYVKSRNDNQLRGVKQTSTSGDCSPFLSWENTSASYTYAPCGAIANSMFNGQFSLLESVIFVVNIFF